MNEEMDTVLVKTPKKSQDKSLSNDKFKSGKKYVNVCSNSQFFLIASFTSKLYFKFWKIIKLLFYPNECLFMKIWKYTSNYQIAKYLIVAHKLA